MSENKMVENKDFIYYHLEAINSRTIEIQKEMNKLKYLFELKKSKTVASTIKSMTEDDKKVYDTKRKMYLVKLNKEEIKTPKPETLEYYNIYKDENEYKIKDST